MYFYHLTFYFILCFNLVAMPLQAQPTETTHLEFNFDNHQFTEAKNQLQIKPVAVNLTTDRFGNKQSAVYLPGNPFSYLNLGTSALLKPTTGTLALWVKIENKIYAGRGAETNPIIITKNTEGNDFYEAYQVSYIPTADRLYCNLSKDSSRQITVASKDTVDLRNWYHVVLTYNDETVAFYLDGKLQGQSSKGFTTSFLPTDSVVMGITANQKNERWSFASVDDIHIFHRVLSSSEIENLYNAPNPNRLSNLLKKAGQYAIITGIALIAILVIVFRNRQKLKKQKERYELENKINELEIKVIKAQMNPHFISNCLSAIQELIYTGQVEKAGLYLAKFSFFLRSVLDYSDKTFISVKEEIEIIERIVELEQLRFKDDFAFQLQVDKTVDTDNTEIPSLITQPFIENAIWHGLLPLNGTRKAVLKISIYKKDTFIFIDIEDNGVGRNLKKVNIDKVSRGTKLAKDKLHNTNMLRRTDHYKLNILDLVDENELPCGTKISIRLSDYEQ